jgi:AcrR family transcriptional regulator
MNSIIAEIHSGERPLSMDRSPNVMSMYFKPSSSLSGTGHLRPEGNQWIRYRSVCTCNNGHDRLQICIMSTRGGAAVTGDTGFTDEVEVLMKQRALVDQPRSRLHPRAVRDRILDVAGDLFYQQGVRAVGVDLIVERSGVAKTSLYRYFATKDDLVAAVLERADARYWAEWDERAADDPGRELQSHLDWIAADIAGPGYRGCPFLNVATEFPSSDHPGRIVAARHKRELHRRIAALVVRMGLADSERMADQLVLLIDGAYANGELLGLGGPARSLTAVARALISA